MARRRKSVLLVAVLLLIAAIIATAVVFQPLLEVRVERTLVGPDEKAIELLDQQRPLAEIKSAVQESGKGVDEISWFYGSLLYWAVDKRRQDVAQWLLQCGANPNGLDPAMPPLGAAISREDVQAVKLLVKWKADPDLRARSGITPRDIAETVGNAEILAALPPPRGTTPIAPKGTPPEAPVEKVP